jgi:hypothetical protein
MAFALNAKSEQVKPKGKYQKAKGGTITFAF